MCAEQNCSSRRFNSLILRFTLADRQTSPESWRQNKLISTSPAEPPEPVKEKIEQVRAKAAAHGRKIRFGIRLHVIVRETNDEAWQAAERLISHLDDEETIAKAQAAFARTDSVGQQRMAALRITASATIWRSAPIYGRALA